MPSLIPVPDDVQLDGPTGAGTQGPKFVPVPDNIKLDSEAPTANAPSNDDYGAARNFLTALARVPGVIAGAPRAVLSDLPNYLTAKASNLFTGGNMTGADVQQAADKQPHVLPSASDVLPSAQGVDNLVFRGLSALTGQPIQPYQPTTPAGQIGQAGVTALAGGAIDPVADLSLFPRLASALKSGIAGTAAEGTHQLFPNSDVLPFLAAVTAHGATTAGARAGGAAGNVALDTGRQIFAPTAAGQREAAVTLSKTAHDPLNALAQPTDSDLQQAGTDVQDATGDIGAGVAPYQAGANIRADLANTQATLTANRQAAYQPLRDAVTGSTATVDLSPIVADVKAQAASRGGLVGDALSQAADQFTVGNTAMIGTASHANNVLENLGDLASSFPAGSKQAATVLAIKGQVEKAVYDAVPEVATARAGYADLSRPLDVFDGNKSTVTAVPDAVARDRFGNFNGTPPSEIPDSFLRGTATKEKLDQLVSAYGGDRNAALSHLQDFLAGKAQSAIQPDGTFDTAAYGRAIGPYQKALGGNLKFWFPGLADKFENASAAQATLDTMNTQRGLAQAIQTGGLRDSTGAITGESMGRWLTQNQKALAQTQSAGAVMRLRNIAESLNVPAGELADAIKSDILPTAVGVMTAGGEGGIIGGMLRHATHAAFGGLDAKRAAAFNGTIERAVLDPTFAANLSAGVAQRRRYLSPARALTQSVAAAIPASEAVK